MSSGQRSAAESDRLLQCGALFNPMGGEGDGSRGPGSPCRFSRLDGTWNGDAWRYRTLDWEGQCRVVVVL